MRPREQEDGMNLNLGLQFVYVTEQAAIAAARTMGQGNRKHSDHVAVEAMRARMDTLQMDATIVIGEGERDKAPMLYEGEKVGALKDQPDAIKVSIAVDPLEGTNLCATGSANAIAVLAASEMGGLLQAPDVYMEKIVVGPTARGKIDIEAPIEENIKRIARAFERDIAEITLVVLERDRHEDLISRIRKAGARIKLITDGDLSAGIAAAVRGTGVHGAVGIGGSPEGVITAAAVRCLGGDMQARFHPTEPWQEKRMSDLGFTDFNKVYDAEELAPGKNLFFCATGVTSGDLLQGVRFFGGGVRTSSIFMSYADRIIRFIDSVYQEERVPVSLR